MKISQWVHKNLYSTYSYMYNIIVDQIVGHPYIHVVSNVHGVTPDPQRWLLVRALGSIQ